MNGDQAAWEAGAADVTSVLLDGLERAHDELKRQEKAIDCLFKLMRLVAPGQADDVLDIEAVSKLLKLGEGAVSKKVRDESIPFRKISGDRGVRFIREDILTWLREGYPGRVRGRGRPPLRLSPDVERG